MPFFRRSPDASRATTRPAGTDDITAISRLLRDSRHRFVGFNAGDLPALLASAPGVVLANDSELLGAALAGWRAEATCWLRALALADGLPVADGLAALLPSLHQRLRAQGIARFYYAGDLSADAWLLPALQTHGYRDDTQVVVYEKTSLDVPTYGSQAARVRPAQMVDLAAILAVDAAAFAPQWIKDEGVLGPALGSTPFFVVAELAGDVVGYAFATSHFAGRLVHLVRIAVDPAHQGQAIGARLLAEVVSFARSGGAATLTLNTQIDNHSAQRLYERFGFRRTGERQQVLRIDFPSP